MDRVFWFSLAFVGYTYVGYPLLIWLLSRLRPAAPEAAPPPAWPEITVVIAVHNEAARIDDKIRDLRAQSYPQSQLRIVVVADGCTDDTVARLQAHSGVTTLSYADRRGKPAALNLAMAQVSTPVVVFMDVRQRLNPDALRQLVSRLQQPGVGAVSGELIHLDPATQTAASIGVYWRYEKWIRKAEGRWDSTVGATGALLAMHTRLYRPLPNDTLLDDLVQPMNVVRSGHRVLIDDAAHAYDVLQTRIAGERKRKVRTLAGNFQAFADHPWLLLPGANRLWFQFVSHKVFRLLVPYALVLMLVSAGVIGQGFYLGALVAQLAFYAMALLGHLMPGSQAWRIVSLASVFVELNLAAVQALWRFATGRLDARWEKT